jgi:hypothetical protein
MNGVILNSMINTTLNIQGRHHMWFNFFQNWISDPWQKFEHCHLGCLQKKIPDMEDLPKRHIGLPHPVNLWEPGPLLRDLLVLLSRKGEKEEIETELEQVEECGKRYTINGKVSSSWGKLINKNFEIDPLQCPVCKALMRIIAFITDYQEVRKNSQTHRRGNDPTSATPAWWSFRSHLWNGNIFCLNNGWIPDQNLKKLNSAGVVYPKYGDSHLFLT